MRGFMALVKSFIKNLFKKTDYNTHENEIFPGSLSLSTEWKRKYTQTAFTCSQLRMETPAQS